MNQSVNAEKASDLLMASVKAAYPTTDLHGSSENNPFFVKVRQPDRYRP